MITWNVGGLPQDRVLQLLCDLRNDRIHLFCKSFVLCLEEVITETGKFTYERQDIQLICGKQDSDWRGTGIAHTSDLQHYRHRQLKCGTSTSIGLDDMRLRVLSGHMPHHALNETFTPGDDSNIHSDSARGEVILTWWTAQGGDIPEQNLGVPSYFPYNDRMMPRSCRTRWGIRKLAICTAADRNHGGGNPHMQHFRRQPCDSYEGSLATSPRRHWGNPTSVFAGGKQTDITASDTELLFRERVRGKAVLAYDMSVDLEAPPTGQTWKTPPDLMTVIEDVGC